MGLANLRAFPAACVAVLAAGSLPAASCWRTAGTLPTSSRFIQYVGKFCFDDSKSPEEEAGMFTLHITGKVEPEPAPLPSAASRGPPCWGPCKTHGTLYIMVFDDEDEEQRWRAAQQDWNEMRCEEFVKDAYFAMPLQLGGGPFNRTTAITKNIRPLFLYFTFAACGVRFVEPVSFEIHAENVLQGFQSEFAIDERGSLLLQFVALLFFSIIVLCLRSVARRSTGLEALRSRPLLRMLVLSAAFSAIGAGCLTLHLLIFSFNGWGWGTVEIIGAAWLCAAKATLTVLQLLTAKGWVLFYSPEDLVQRRVVICLITCIVVISMACEIHAQFYRDWSTAVYLYESFPGMTILFFNVVLFAEASRSMQETYRHETSREVRVFYVVISAASFCYFLTLPLMCLLAHTLNPWSRAKWVARVEVFSRLLATALLAFALRPSRLDAMVNARAEDGLETLGEMRDDVSSEEDAACGFVDGGQRGGCSASDDDEDRVDGRGGEAQQVDAEQGAGRRGHSEPDEARQALIEPLRPAE